LTAQPATWSFAAEERPPPTLSSLFLLQADYDFLPDDPVAARFVRARQYFFCYRSRRSHRRVLDADTAPAFSLIPPPE
jgi:hypothetical protein